MFGNITTLIIWLVVNVKPNVYSMIWYNKCALIDKDTLWQYNIHYMINVEMCYTKTWSQSITVWKAIVFSIHFHYQFEIRKAAKSRCLAWRRKRLTTKRAYVDLIEGRMQKAIKVILYVNENNEKVFCGNAFKVCRIPRIVTTVWITYSKTKFLVFSTFEEMLVWQI